MFSKAAVASATTQTVMRQQGYWWFTTECFGHFHGNAVVIYWLIDWVSDWHIRYLLFQRYIDYLLFQQYIGCLLFRQYIGYLLFQRACQAHAQWGWRDEGLRFRTNSRVPGHPRIHASTHPRIRTSTDSKIAGGRRQRRADMGPQGALDLDDSGRPRWFPTQALQGDSNPHLLARRG